MTEAKDLAYGSQLLFIHMNRTAYYTQVGDKYVCNMCAEELFSYDEIVKHLLDIHLVTDNVNSRTEK